MIDKSLEEIQQAISLFNEICKKLKTNNPVEKIKKLLEEKERLEEELRKLEKYEDSRGKEC